MARIGANTRLMHQGHGHPTFLLDEFDRQFFVLGPPNSGKSALIANLETLYPSDDVQRLWESIKFILVSRADQGCWFSKFPRELISKLIMLLISKQPSGLREHGIQVHHELVALINPGRVTEDWIRHSSHPEDSYFFFLVSLTDFDGFSESHRLFSILVRKGYPNIFLVFTKMDLLTKKLSQDPQFLSTEIERNSFLGQKASEQNVILSDFNSLVSVVCNLFTMAEVPIHFTCASDLEHVSKLSNRLFRRTHARCMMGV